MRGASAGRPVDSGAGHRRRARAAGVDVEAVPVEPALVVLVGDVHLLAAAPSCGAEAANWYSSCGGIHASSPLAGAAGTAARTRRGTRRARRRSRPWSPAVDRRRRRRRRGGRIGDQVLRTAHRRPSRARRRRRTVCHTSGARTASASAALGRVGRRDRVRVDERLAVVADAGSISASHWRPIASRRSSDIGRPPLVSGSGRRSTLASNGTSSSNGCVAPRVRPVLGQPRGVDLQLGEHRRAGVAAAELAHLPLLGQHPQRIADLGPQRAVEARACAAGPSSRFQVVTVGKQPLRRARSRMSPTWSALGMLRASRRCRCTPLAAARLVVIEMPYSVAAMIVAGRKRAYAVWSICAGSTARFFARSSVSFSAPTRSSHCQVPLGGGRRDEQDRLRRLVVGTVEVERDAGVVRSVAGITSVHSSSSRPHWRGVTCRTASGSGRCSRGGRCRAGASDRELHREPGRAGLVGELHGQQRRASGSPNASASVIVVSQACEHGPDPRGAVEPLVDGELDVRRAGQDSRAGAAGRAPPRRWPIRRRASAASVNSGTSCEVVAEQRLGRRLQRVRPARPATRGVVVASSCWPAWPRRARSPGRRLVPPRMRCRSSASDDRPVLERGHVERAAMSKAVSGSSAVDGGQRAPRSRSGAVEQRRELAAAGARTRRACRRGAARRVAGVGRQRVERGRRRAARRPAAP